MREEREGQWDDDRNGSRKPEQAERLVEQRDRESEHRRVHDVVAERLEPEQGVEGDEFDRLHGPRREPHRHEHVVRATDRSARVLHFRKERPIVAVQPQSAQVR